MKHYLKILESHRLTSLDTYTPVALQLNTSLLIQVYLLTVHFEDCLQFRPIARGHISQIYSTLEHTKADSVSKARKAWELDLNLQISDDLWDLSVSRIHESSICTRHCIIQFKILHRAYLTKAKLAKIYNTSDDGSNHLLL